MAVSCPIQYHTSRSLPMPCVGRETKHACIPGLLTDSAELVECGNIFQIVSELLSCAPFSLICYGMECVKMFLCFGSGHSFFPLLKGMYSSTQAAVSHFKYLQ